MMEPLTSGDMTPERWESLGHRIASENNWPDPFNPDHFFTVVRSMMDRGIAKAWGCEDGLLVALFVENTFTGKPGAMVLSWWSIGRGAMALFEAFEAEAARRGVRQQYVSVFGSRRAAAMKRLYRMNGYQPHEEILVKLR